MPLRGIASGLFGAAFEARRRAYARGWLRPAAAGARVVSVGNLTVGGTGKTTLTLHLARRARALGIRVAVVCRNYRPGPSGEGDEARLYREALGPERVFAGDSKLRLAREASASGASLVLVDDGFSHWRLARDLDVVLLDAGDPWGGGRLLPAGRLREPRRALQRAGVVVVTRLPAAADPAPWLDEVRPYAPAARLAAGRHRVTGVSARGGGPVDARERVRVVTATGNPQAVAASAAEWGLQVVDLSAYRDHHWFTPGEARREAESARARDARVLLTAKDAVRWPEGGGEALVLEVEWEWVRGGEVVERLALEGERV